MKKVINKSLALKLVFMYVMASFVVLAIFALTVQHAITNHFYEQDYLHLEEKLKSLAPNAETKLNIFDSLNISAWVLENGQVIKSNREVNRFPVEMVSSSSYEWSEGDLIFRAFKFKSSPESDRSIVLAMEITHHKLFFKKLNSILLWTLVLSVGLSGAYALVIVRSGLMPLKVLKNYIEKVSTSNLNVRLPSDSLPVELKSLAASQNEMLERLQSGFIRLSEFSSDIAHELRTPLTNIMMQTQVALVAKRSVEEYQDILASNLEELERLNKTISDTLYLAKSENELLHKAKTELHLRDIFTSLLDYYEALAEEENVRITVDGEMTLLGDKDMLQRAFGNVLSNALRHCFPDTEISVLISDSGGRKTVKISNTGEPIPQSSLPYIFDRFYRSDKSRVHSNSVGAGLGLPIAKAIMHAHGGDIAVSSIENRTEFEFVFDNV
ncbi:heavy metal sensor histidine kinase [Vibrio sp. S9_S30]|uniref:heavy metal sensor histidine kinase n=1 Tax=Vibrio sp. S9_S30 TaxID=2720226 RepID=UPI0016802A0A|nr:heavy metal sensor histidine kinase [Vibrio sp. S9_S30]MBD1555729.1 heavy metal sensor histidine kinase [Vibrio sp. S9_S30]